MFTVCIFSLNDCICCRSLPLLHYSISGQLYVRCCLRCRSNKHACTTQALTALSTSLLIFSTIRSYRQRCYVFVYMYGIVRAHLAIFRIYVKHWLYIFRIQWCSLRSGWYICISCRIVSLSRFSFRCVYVLELCLTFNFWNRNTRAHFPFASAVEALKQNKTKWNERKVKLKRIYA